MRKDSIGLAFAKSAHLLDATNLIVIAWNEIKQQTILIAIERQILFHHFVLMMLKSVKWKLNALMIMLH